MQQNIKRRGLFSLISPFLVFFGVSLVVQIIAVMIVVFQNLPALMEGMDMQAIENIQNMQQMYISEEAMNMLMKKYLSNLTMITAASAACALPFFWWMFRRDQRYEQMLGIPQMKKTRSVSYIYIILFSIAANLAFNNILLLSNLGAYSEGYQAANEALYSGSFLVQIIGLGFVTPIAEEVMFRGLIYRRIRCMIGPKQAMIVSGLVFGMYHVNLVQGIYGFLIGCVLAWLYEKYGSLKAPILCHICANLVSLIATEFEIFTWIFRQPIRVISITVVSAACAAAVYVQIRNKFIDEQKDVEINVE